MGARAGRVGGQRLSDFPTPPGHPPPPRPYAAWAFAHYVRRQARRYFGGLHWRRPPPPRDPSLPTIFVANHTNWWDGFFACLVTGALGLRFQVLMEAQHLMRYRAFLRVGALPIRRDSPKGALADLLAARAYLGADAGLWIFPQGRRRPPAEPIGQLERGVAELVHRYGAPVHLVPVAFRYTFVGEQLPEGFAWVGEGCVAQPAAAADRRGFTDDVATTLRATISTLDSRLAGESFADFETLVAGRMSVNKRMDRFRHAVGLLRGPFERRNG